MSAPVLRFAIKLTKTNLFRKYYNHGDFIRAQRRAYTSRSGAVVIEIGQGAGGEDSMIFAHDLMTVYRKYAASKGWPNQVESIDTKTGSEVRTAKLVVDGPDVFDNLVGEAGVHRVQRVPTTEKRGRVHTSTATVMVTPKYIVDINIEDRDCEWQMKTATGAGGQFVNRTYSAVRLIHKPTGIAVESQEQRHQHQNKKTAMSKLLDKIREQEMDKLTGQMTAIKRSQVRNANRSEKIRTYNFPNDRITDHRLGKSYHRLRAMFLDGDVSVLDAIIRDLNEASAASP